MAKRRVYELAREMNMTNKELMDKLEEMDIEIKSHMSSLEEDTIATIKDSLYGRKEKAEVEDTRVKPNIIRRRRRPKAESAEEAESFAEEEAEAAEMRPEELRAEEPPEVKAEPPEAESEETSVSPEATEVKEAPEPSEEPGLAEAEPAVEKEKAESTEEIPETEVVKTVAEKTEEPVPEEKTEIGTTVSEEVPEEAFEVEKQEEKSETEVEEKLEEPVEVPPAETTVEAPEMPEAQEEKPEETEIAAESATQSAAEPAEKVGQEQEKRAVAEKPEDKTEKPKKTKKKSKKSTPAKIISLPEEKPEQPEEPEPEIPKQVQSKKTRTPAEQRQAPARPDHGKKPAEPVVEATAPSEDKRKGRKKKVEVAAAPEVETAADKAKKGKKKSSFKRKEVVEGDALYDKRFGRVRKGKKKGKAARTTSDFKPQITVPKAIKRRIKVDDTIVLADLAKRMGVKANELIKRLMGMGVMITVNQTIDYDTASLLAAEFNFEVEKAAFEEESFIKTEEDAPEQMQFRPPVVTIMGHVDHGKTSLLDVIRHSKVADKEAGGITQHIGAYHVPHDKGDIIFLDTPGHEAFTAMRGRGAQVTDIVILVVAADDGVMPQTIEAIDHSKAAGVPIIVAVNKIDKPGAEPDRIKRELAERDLVPEDWGGDTIFVNVSAKEEIGLDDLLEMVIIQSEVLELKANPEKKARGYIIESKLETGRGPVATVLIQEGTLHVGEAVVSGMYYGKIRAMFNDKGKPVSEAGPSYPVEIVGLSGVPMAGDELITLADEKNAKQVSEHRTQKQRSAELAKTSRMSLDNLYERMQVGEVKDLNLILKADVQGSIEALKDSLERLSTEEVKINVIHSATGTIHESDVSLAAVSNAIILGFNVRPSGKVTQMADEENVDIRYYNVIYNAIKDIKSAMVGLMDSKYEERVLGRAEVRQVFTVPGIGAVAGCMVVDGKIQRGQPIRLVRDGIVIHEGKIASLRRYKDDVKEVHQNYECGIGIEKFNDIKTGDIIECFYLEEIKPVME